MLFIMEKKKIIAVVGATGAQGGGLVRSILYDSKKEFAVRAITRDVNSKKALELKELGAEVVLANLNDKDSIVKAFKGAYGAYCVTFFWDHFSPEKEMEQAKNMALAAKEVGLKHVIWSTLEDTRKWVPLTDKRMPTLMGSYKVPHFDAKGASNTFFEQSGVPYTLLLTSFYWDNFIYFGLGPTRGMDGKLRITMPMGSAKLPGIAAEDIGKSALGIFRGGKKYQNKTVGIAGEHITGKQMAEAFTTIFGVEIGFKDIPADDYRKLGFPGADDLGNMFQFKKEFEDYFCKVRDVNFTKELNPNLMSFKSWLIKNKGLLESGIKGEAAMA